MRRCPPLHAWTDPAKEVNGLAMTTHWAELATADFGQCLWRLSLTELAGESNA